MIRVQNREMKVVVNIVHNTLSIKHFVFFEQIVLMNGFSIGSLIMYDLFLKFWALYPND